jgi:hypothetical protein
MTAPARVERRKLRFASLDEVVSDARMLQEKGYQQAGNWDLGQVCSHVAEWMRYPIEGYPRLPLPARAIFWLVRVIFARRIMRKVLAEGLPAGKPTLSQSVTQPGGDQGQAVEMLRKQVESFKGYTGEMHPSPLFGAMDKELATRLQLVHCAHHLSFLVPKS